jgi:hypothetical protein
MKGLKKFQFLFFLALIFAITFSASQDNQGDSTITIMEQDEQDERNIEEDPSDNTDSITDDPSGLEDDDELNEGEFSARNNTDNNFKPKVVEQLPEAKVIVPIRRKDTSHTALNIAPCGGVNKRKADTLTNKGSIFNIIWETINPASQANCTVKLSPGIESESNFTLLYRLDSATDSNGAFPCGRVKGFESQQFKLPDDYVCDQCTVQWAWHTEYGVLYSCSDVIINGNKIEECLARCKNGGACFNGKCLCKEGFYGDFCENSSKNNFLLFNN